MSRIAIITGGSRGLGANAALHLARTGVDIILTYHSSKDEADKVVASIEEAGARAVALPLDVSRADTFAAFADSVRAALKVHWSRDNFDILINNAGVALYAGLTETTIEQFDNIVNVHLKAPYFLTNALLPLLTDGGRILNVSSGLARFAMPGSSAYGAVKGAVEVLTRYQAKELGARRISANVIAPGAIETDFGSGRVRDNKEVNAHVASQTALGRVGLPDDIGGAIAALLAPENGWMTAQRVEVSGGMFI